MSDEEERPLDRSPYYVNHFEHLDRVLGRPQLAGIGVCACVGAGLFITSGELISTTGSVGAAVSYVIAGGIVACVLYTITEMVVCRPLTGALIDLPHTFLDPACGFTVAALYGLGKICAMATLTGIAAETTSLLRHDQEPNSTKFEAAINVAFIALTTLSHCLGVKLYGKIERVLMWFKLCLIVLCIILMIALNFGGGGTKKEELYSTNYTTNAFTPGWNPTGFQQAPASSQLKLRNVPESGYGIAGGGGTVFAFITSITLAMFSCLGADLVAMTAGEAKNPWKDVGATMSFVYLVPLGLYPFVMFAAGANVNYADPKLPKIWVSSPGATKSPFVIAAEQSSLHALPVALNAFFILSAYTTANTNLYAASRSFFMLSQQYLPKKIANIFGRTNHGHTPLASILLCSALGFLSLIGLIDRSSSQPRITLSELYTGSATTISLCLCVTFLNFKAGLDRLEKKKIFSRNDPLYRSRLFKSRWQPLPAYIGIVGSTCVIIWSGIPPLVLLATKGSVSSIQNLKSTVSLVFDVLGAYIGPFLFGVLYCSYKYIHPRTSRVDIRKLTVEDYVLEDLSKIELEVPESTLNLSSSYSAPHHHHHHHHHHQQPYHHHELDAARADAISPMPDALSPEPQQHPRAFSRESAASPTDVVSPTATFDSYFKEDAYVNVQASVEAQEEAENEEARRRERERIAQILRKRPRRMERGVLRELWSFVVEDKEDKEEKKKKKKKKKKDEEK